MAGCRGAGTVPPVAQEPQAGQEPKAPAPKPVPDPKGTTDGNDEVPRQAFYRAEVEGVLAGSYDGLVAVRLWVAPGVPGTDVCILEPVANEVRTRISPAPGATIGKVALDREWLAWVERAGNDWTLKARRFDQFPDQALIINSGRYTARTGPDFPTPCLDSGRLAYDISRDSGQTMDSRIILIDLASGTERTVSSLTAADAYLGPPSLSGNRLVWHQGEWAASMRATVFLHDLEAGTTTALPKADGVAMLSPMVSNNHIVWVQYETARPETKNIMLWNIHEDLPRMITDATPANFREYWHPTVAFGLVTWKTNLPSNQVPVYCFHPDSTYHNQPIDSTRAHMNAIHGSWLTWRRFDIPGTYFVPLTRYGFLLDMSDRRDRPTPIALPDCIDEDTLRGGLTPAQVLALWHRCSREGPLELIARITEHGEPADGIVSVSPHYIICGDKAYGSVSQLHYRHGLFWANLRVERHEGIWRIPFLAAQ